MRVLYLQKPVSVLYKEVLSNANNLDLLSISEHEHLGNNQRADHRVVFDPGNWVRRQKHKE